MWFGLTALFTLLVFIGTGTHALALLRAVGLLAERTRCDLSVCVAVLGFRLLLLLNPQIISLLQASGCTKPDWTFYCTPVSPANGETQLLDQSFVWMA